jgi:indole-3-glycerol phosphate synthase
MSLLDDILAVKREEVGRLLGAPPDPSGAPPPRSLARALSTGRTPRVIAEVKRASPSKGTLRELPDPVPLACSYAAAGATAISVLTDERWFKGSLGDLSAVRGAIDVPVLCKDFLVDPIQVTAARAAGADACLLIVAALPGGALGEMLAAVRDGGMEALVEAHDADERDRAVDVGARIIGVNNRDLRTFHTDLAVAEGLLPGIPADRLRVAESGLSGRADIDRMVAAGADACLVGEALLRAEEPGARLADWLAGP